jgi:hypothetical protein
MTMTLPKKHTSHGGDYKTIVGDLKSRFGEDVVNELEKEIKDDADQKKIRKKEMAQQSKSRDGKNQSKISSFFEKKPKVEHDEAGGGGGGAAAAAAADTVIDLIKEEEDNDDDHDVSKLELMKLALENELRQIQPNGENDVKDEELADKKDSDYDDDEETGLQFDMQEEEEENDKKRKADDDIADKISKLPRLETFKKAAEAFDMNEDDPTKKAAAAVNAKLAARRKRNKSKMSEIVINTLNQFYRDKKFGGSDPKALFKTIARKLTYHFYDKDPDFVSKEEIKDFIFEIFYNSYSQKTLCSN